MNRRTPANKQAVIYLREATTENVNNHHSSAHIERQRRTCIAKAQELGAASPIHFIDQGQSGNKLDRPGLQALLRHLESSPTDYVITADSARLTRNRSQEIELHKAITGHGSELVLAKKSRHQNLTAAITPAHLATFEAIASDVVKAGTASKKQQQGEAA